MFNENQLVKIKWHNTNRAYYEELGYMFTVYGDAFFVKAKDLPLGSNMRIELICDFCGDKYTSTFKNYNNRTNKECDACQKCNMKKKYFFNRKERAHKYFELLQDICKKNDYILLSSEDDYIDQNTEIQYICKKHGLKTAKVQAMLCGRGCRECGYEKASDIKTHSPEYIKEYIERFNGNALLNPDEYIGTTVRNLRVKCSCGNIFVVSFNDYMSSNVRRCRQCSMKESVGEYDIRMFLENNNIDFEQEKRFDDCRDKKPLPFDFYLPDYNLIIEFDGQIHYHDTVFGNHALTVRHDKMKNEYCQSHNIDILRIPYWEGNNIESILTEKLNL